MSSSQIHKRLSKCNISAEKRFLYGKLGPYQKTREITAGHLVSAKVLNPSLCLLNDSLPVLATNGVRYKTVAIKFVLLRFVVIPKS